MESSKQCHQITLKDFQTVKGASCAHRSLKKCNYFTVVVAFQKLICIYGAKYLRLCLSNITYFGEGGGRADSYETRRPLNHAA